MAIALDSFQERNSMNDRYSDYNLRLDILQELKVRDFKPEDVDFVSLDGRCYDFASFLLSAAKQTRCESINCGFIIVMKDGSMYQPWYDDENECMRWAFLRKPKLRGPIEEFTDDSLLNEIHWWDIVPQTEEKK